MKTAYIPQSRKRPRTRQSTARQQNEEITQKNIGDTLESVVPVPVADDFDTTGIIWNRLSQGNFIIKEDAWSYGSIAVSQAWTRNVFVQLPNDYKHRCVVEITHRQIMVSHGYEHIFASREITLDTDAREMVCVAIVYAEPSKFSEAPKLATGLVVGDQIKDYQMRFTLYSLWQLEIVQRFIITTDKYDDSCITGIKEYHDTNVNGFLVFSMPKEEQQGISKPVAIILRTPFGRSNQVIKFEPQSYTHHFLQTAYKMFRNNLTSVHGSDCTILVPADGSFLGMAMLQHVYSVYYPYLLEMKDVSTDAIYNMRQRALDPLQYILLKTPR